MTLTTMPHDDVESPVSPFDPTTNTLRPPQDSLVTIRVIKSFTYRTCKSVVLDHIDLRETTVSQLKELVKHAIRTRPGWKPYQNAQLDTLKIFTKAHGAKTTNLIINLDRDDWMLSDDNQTLAQAGLENESEVSFFGIRDYEAYKASPEHKW